MDWKTIPLNVEVYKKCGQSTPAAVVYAYIRKWCEFNKRDPYHFRNGRYWMFQTIEAMSSDLSFPGLSVRNLKRILQLLVRVGIVKRGNFNSSWRNRTCWYSVDLDSAIYDTMDDATLGTLHSASDGTLHSATLGTTDNIDNLTNNELDNECENSRTHTHVESATAGTLGPDTDWRTALAAALDHNAEYEADALANLDAMEREARADPSYPHRDAQLAFCAAQRASVRANRRLFDAMDALSCGLDDPAIDLAPCDTTFTDADGNPFCYFDLCDERYGDLNWTVQKFYVETCWAENREPTASDFATTATQQWLADGFAAEVARRDAEYDEFDAESDDLARSE